MTTIWLNSVLWRDNPHLGFLVRFFNSGFPDPISIHFVKFWIFTLISIHFVNFPIFTQISIHFLKFRIFTLISIRFVKFRIFTLISIRFTNFRINTSTSIHFTRKFKTLHLRILWLIYINKLDKFSFQKRGLKALFSANPWAAICRKRCLLIGWENAFNPFC